MAMTMHVDVVSAEELLFSDLAGFVAAPAAMGEVGIYPRHAPMLALLRAGVVRLKIPYRMQEKVIYISGGILEVQPKGVTILSDMAVREKAVQEGQLWDKKRKAEETIKNRVTAMEYAKLELELAKAFSHLQGIQKLRHGK